MTDFLVTAVDLVVSKEQRISKYGVRILLQILKTAQCWTSLLPFSVLEGSVSSKKNSWIVWPLKMGPIGCPEKSVTNHPSTLRKNHEQRRFQDSILWNLTLRVIMLGVFVL